MNRPTFFIISTGTELTSGRSADVNAPYLARLLSESGFNISGILVLPDDNSILKEEIRAILQRSGVSGVIISGGLGPTEDDKTIDVLAQLTAGNIREDPHALIKIKKLVNRSENRFNLEIVRRQARVLCNAKVIKNLIGLAPGIIIDYIPEDQDKKKIIIALPGVPQEMRAMADKYLLLELKKRFQFMLPERAIFYLYGIGESSFQSRFFENSGKTNEKKKFPADFVWGVSSKRGFLEVFFESLKRDEILRMEQRVRNNFSDNYINQPVTGALSDLCLENKFKIGFAESCSGGLAGKIVTDLPGSSVYFKGSIVAYDNDVKMRLLGVSAATLNNEGAVSEKCAIEMARGAIKALQVDFALSITGIAGPGGGTKSKPAGTVFIGCVNKSGATFKKKLTLPSDREYVREYSANIALFFLYRFILGSDTP